MSKHEARQIANVAKFARVRYWYTYLPKKELRTHAQTLLTGWREIRVEAIHNVVPC